jgi:hypothetical protein
VENAGGALEPLDKRRELVGIASEPELMMAATRHSVAVIFAVLPLSCVGVLSPFCRFFAAESQFYRYCTAILRRFSLFQ